MRGLVCLGSVFGFGAAQDLFLAQKPSRFSWTMDDTNAFDEYVSAPDPNFKWFDTQTRVKMLSGSVGHVLNLTSQQWLDTSKAVGPAGALWTHQVLVIVPKTMKVTNKAVIYITGGCNENPSVPKATDEEPLAMEVLSRETGAIGVVLNQIPNCHIVFPSDPSKRPRQEDAMLAWAFHEFFQTRNPAWIPFFPMVKAAMQAMRAVEEYTKAANIANIDGWIATGASKRGWTAFMAGAVKCESCPTIDAIAPIVPIVPDLRAGLHHMYQAYGGWSFAFKDYLDVNLTRDLDGEGFQELLKLADPINYIDRLEKLPKFVSVSSDDEFMMMEWTRLWFDQFTGEKHLMIANNAEHSMATGVVELIESLGNFVNSVYLGGTRPSFQFDQDLVSGQITVRIPEQLVHGKVVLRHTHTPSAKRRDFRWAALPKVSKGGNLSCTLPNIGPVKGLCIQPLVWTGTTLHATSPGLYKASLEKPLWGWIGAYVEVYFPSDTGMKREYQMTTGGMVWPQTLPFSDCHGSACEGSLV